MIHKEDDIFDKALREKLTKTEGVMPPAWDELFDIEAIDALEREVSHKSRALSHRRSIFKISVIAAALAALAFFVTTYLPKLNPINKSEFVASKEREIEDITPQNNDKKEIELLTTKKDTRLANFDTQKKISAIISNDNDVEQPKSSSQIVEKEKKVEHKEVNTPKDVDKKAIQEQQRQQQREENYYRTLKEVVNSKKRENKFDLLASSSLISSSSSGNKISPMMMALSSPIKTYVYDSYSVKKPILFFPDQYSHKMPLTAAIQLGYNITDKIKLSSGMQYSHYNSTAESVGSVTYKLDQKVDYIGIPIALNYTYFNSNKINLYATIGGTSCWVVRCKKVVDGFSGDHKTSSTTERERVKGAIFSSNVGLGIEYSVGEYFGLFAEPTFDYIFNNNNHPSTYKTTRKSNLNVKVGISINM